MATHHFIIKPNDFTFCHFSIFDCVFDNMALKIVVFIQQTNTYTQYTCYRQKYKTFNERIVLSVNSVVVCFLYMVCFAFQNFPKTWNVSKEKSLLRKVKKKKKNGVFCVPNHVQNESIYKKNWNLFSSIVMAKHTQWCASIYSNNGNEQRKKKTWRKNRRNNIENTNTKRNKQCRMGVWWKVNYLRVQYTLKLSTECKILFSNIITRS